MINFCFTAHYVLHMLVLVETLKLDIKQIVVSHRAKFIVITNFGPENM